MKLNKAKLNQVRNNYNLSLILLHGSQVDGKTHPKSDVDIAVVRKESNKLKLLEIIKDLSKALHSSKIDLSDITHADPLFLYLVTRKSKLLSGKKGDYDSLLRLAYHKYNDYLPYLEKERDFVTERIKTYVSN